jgi:hypothetical protein
LSEIVLPNCDRDVFALKAENPKKLEQEPKISLDQTSID